MKFIFYTIALFCCSISMKAQSEGKLVPILSGFNEPLDLTCPFDGTDRLFVTEKAGRIKILQGDMMIGTFLDIRQKVSNNSERGLLGLAFHPNYQDNGYVFVSYTGLGPEGDFNSIISRFQVSSTDPNELDESSELEFLKVTQPFDNHNGGTIKFGPDGFLYIGFGDGGSGGDPKHSGQDLNSLLGKILRIDVDNVSDTSNYSIPEGNPFIENESARNEIWAYGLRNPWKFSFDLVTGDLWIGDVGQSDREEISIIPSGVGGLNFGWRCFEGELNFRPCDPIDHTAPYYTYARPDKNACDDRDFCGKSVTGGFVYRGSDNPDLLGKYFFADYVSNRVWSIDLGTKLVQEITDIGGARKISSFGESELGELYVVSLNGSIYKLEQTSTTSLKSPNFSVFEISPNPFDDQVNIQFYAKGVLQLNDVSGKALKRLIISEPQISLDLSDLASGTYFLRFLSGDKLYFKPLVKQ